MNPGAVNPASEQDISTRFAAQWYGWDSRCRLWHGPIEMNPSDTGHAGLNRGLSATSALSWFSPVTCALDGSPSCRFFVITHDLKDSGLAVIYCNESRVGPLEVISVLPAWRRHEIRQDFGFEFVAFASFLTGLESGVQLQVCEGIECAFKEANSSESLVFSVTTGIWPAELDYALSRCGEQTALSILRWLHRPLKG